MDKVQLIKNGRKTVYVLTTKLTKIEDEFAKIDADRVAAEMTLLHLKGEKNSQTEKLLISK